MQGRVGFALAAALLGILASSGARAQDAAGEADADTRLNAIFDELRVGAITHAFEHGSGPVLSGEVLFHPLAPEFDNYLADAFLRPRIHVGGNLAIDDSDGVDQIFGGFTWHFPLPGPLFLEGSFGGTWHDGTLHDASGLKLGCHFLFRESAAAGLDVGAHWRVIASIDHSSHAGLCGEDNTGVSHAGGYVGYRF